MLSRKSRRELGFAPLFYRQFFDQPFQIVMRLAPQAGAPADEVALSATIRRPGRHMVIETMGHTFAVAFGQRSSVKELDWIRSYSYTTSEDWRYASAGQHGTVLITPPNGSNLLYVARHTSRVYDFFRDTLADLNWKLRFDERLKTFRLSEVREDEILDYPLDLLSDSLKRLFFYGAILLTSENAALVLDEPDVFAFPPYPKTLGEMIADDTSNQFFLTTHNPYFLAGIIGKTPADKLALFVCHRDDDGATSARLLTPPDVSRVVEQGPDVFFNLDEFLTQ